MRITIFSNTFYLVSGGDIIYANLGRELIKLGHEVSIITNEKGRDFCLSQGILPPNIKVQRSSWVDKFPLVIVELYKTLISTLREFFSDRDHPDTIFSSSFFWADLFPAVIAKIKHPSSKLVVGVYLLFPRPSGKKKYHGGQLKLLLLYLSQFVSLALINRFSDLVLTASEKDTPHFKNALAIRGGVDYKRIKRIKSRTKIYDVVYFGRFHSQKGIMDLLDVWRDIKKLRPETTFLMIGGGPLEPDIRQKAKELGLINHLTFSGIQTGIKKYRLLKSSKVFTSTSQFDTGNMALDEVLACGLPGVIYNLPHLNYPEGVVKISIGHKRSMAREVISLLDNPELCRQLGSKGQKFISYYDWSTLARNVLNTFYK